MAMNLHICIDKDVSGILAAQIGPEIQRIVEGPRGHRPVLVMHWVEEPGGRVACHWDIEIPEADATAH